MSENKFYVTTPIYYVNDKPHIGHAYTTILADVITRYHRILRVPSFFLTGTDEHGQKVQKAAVEHKITPQQQCDTTVVRFQELWKKLEIINNDFIRTTEPRHKKIVCQILQDLYDKGEIYKAEYKGRYCVPCERFYTEKDMKEDNLCPECNRETNEIIESNYFFRMGKYQDWLIDYIKTHPDFIQPSFRANETLGFLQKPLSDLCISRPKARLEWGIELPFDKDYVCYVWFDALINYISAVGYGSDEEKFKKWWPASYHLIGKDILTTHTVYWPTMLKAMGVELPQTVFAHGWWLIGQNKMSKSVGNVVNPMEMIEKYGVDAFRYFLMAEMTPGQDASFSEDAFILRYNTELANDLGNLLSRVVKMIVAYFDGKMPPQTFLDSDVDKELINIVQGAVDKMEASIKNLKLSHGLEAVMNAVRAGNRYMEKTAPWTLAKNGDKKRLGEVLYNSAEALRVISVLLYPVMPTKMKELRDALGVSSADIDLCFEIKEGKEAWGYLPGGSNVKDVDLFSVIKNDALPEDSKLGDVLPLFQRINTDKSSDKAKSAAKKADVAKTGKDDKKEENAGVITVDDFFKAKLKTAKILEAEKVEGADKLLKLKIEVGTETRQIVAGIALYYKPEELIGRIIVVVSNLMPAKIRGIESNGMLLAAKDANGLKLITVDGGSFPSGASVG